MIVSLKNGWFLAIKGDLLNVLAVTNMINPIKPNANSEILTDHWYMSSGNGPGNTIW